jgi:parallel beta-helix repeat protein
LITNNLIGTGPTAFYSTILTSGDGVYVDASGRGTIQNNLIGYMESCLIEMNANATSAWTISGNQLSALYSNAYNPISAIVIDTGSNITVSGNLINGNAGSGLESLGGGGLTVTNNTISGNGSGGTSTANQTPGIDLASTSSTISGNIINGNYGAGVLVESGSTTNTISQNSIYGNGTIVSASGAAASGEIGIDLLTSSDTAHTGTSKFITPNKSAGTGTGGDSLLNFPFIDSAYISGASLIVTGYARPGATVEFFVADASPASGFGQGKTYFASAVEGSASDSDSTFGIYNGPGVSIGTDTTNRFRFIIAKGSTSAGSVITASATLAAYGASEFGPNFTVTSTAPVPAMVTVLSQSPSGTSEPPGTVMTYTGVFTNSGAAQGFGITMRDAIPTHTDFQIGSAATAVGISNLTPVTIVYSSDSGATWTYTPVSGGGGASSGYDRLVTNVKFIFGNSISFNSPYNTATFSLSVRIQ